MEVVLHGFNMNRLRACLQGNTASQQSAVWVRQLRKDGAGKTRVNKATWRVAKEI